MSAMPGTKLFKSVLIKKRPSKAGKLPQLKETEEVWQLEYMMLGQMLGYRDILGTSEEI